MTAEDRARAFCNKHVMPGKRGDLANQDLILILKEQDKLTRHACAEAVSALQPGYVMPTAYLKTEVLAAIRTCEGGLK